MCVWDLKSKRDVLFKTAAKTHIQPNYGKMSYYMTRKKEKFAQRQIDCKSTVSVLKVLN